MILRTFLVRFSYFDGVPKVLFFFLLNKIKGAATCHFVFHVARFRKFLVAITYLDIWTELKLACSNPGPQIHCAVHKCICTKVWNCWEVLAYRTQFNDIFSGTHACYCCGNLHAEEALFSFNFNFPSCCTHASLQWVLPETFPTHLHCLPGWGMFTSPVLGDPKPKGYQVFPFLPPPPLFSFRIYYHYCLQILHFDTDFSFHAYFQTLIKKDRADENDAAMAEFLDNLVTAYQDPAFTPIHFSSNDSLHSPLISSAEVWAWDMILFLPYYIFRYWWCLFSTAIFICNAWFFLLDQ